MLKSADVNGHGGQQAAQSHPPKHRKKFLCFPERKDRDGHAPSALERFANRPREALLFFRAGVAGRGGRVSSGCLHHENVHTFLGKIRAAYESLVLEVDIARVKDGPALAADHHARGAEDMA